MASSIISPGAMPSLESSIQKTTSTNVPFKPDHSHQLKPELDPPGVFPERMIIAPKGEHRQSFIILHGRGSFAARFGQPLLDMEDTEGRTLQEMFPHARIVFPTASRNRAMIYNKSYTHQWFDNWHLEDYTKRQELMSSGLQKSVKFIHKLLQREIEAVGKENVVLWGLSQGCATSLTSLLCWDGEPFAATVGMCGWLPYGNMVKDIAGEKEGKRKGSQHDDEDEEDDDPFARSDDEDEEDNPFGGSDDEEEVEKKDAGRKAIDYLREEIEMDDKKGAIFKKILVFLGHGVEDERVSIELGKEAEMCLELVGADVTMEEYEGLAHWYSPEMLRDIFAFLKQKLDNAQE